MRGQENLESKGTFFILIIVVAVLTLALAALAGYLFLVQGTPGTHAEANLNTGQAEEELKPENAIRLSLYDSKKYFNLKNEDPKKIAVIQVSVYLKCIDKLKTDKKANVEELVTAYTPEIQEKVMRFFMNLTLEEVKNPEVFDSAKESLKTQINEILNTGRKEPEKIVYEVIFSEWFYQ